MTSMFTMIQKGLWPLSNRRFGGKKREIDTCFSRFDHFDLTALALSALGKNPCLLVSKVSKFQIFRLHADALINYQFNSAPYAGWLSSVYIAGRFWNRYRLTDEELATCIFPKLLESTLTSSYCHWYVATFRWFPKNTEWSPLQCVVNCDGMMWKES